MTRNLTLSLLLCAATLLSLPQEARAATLDMGPAGTPYSRSDRSRGYYFTAPVDFTITGLRVPEYTSAQTQNIQVVRFDGAQTPPELSSSSSSTTAHNTLFYTASGASGNDFITVNIPVVAGEVIGILGTRGTSTMHNMYGSTNTY